MNKLTKNLNKFSNFKYNRFNPSVNEWKISIYIFNNKYLNFSFLYNNIYYLLNSYFNINLNKISKLKKVYKLKRIFVSVPDIKYSINNINVCIYVFNKELLVIKKKIKKLHFKNIKIFKNLRKIKRFKNFIKIKKFIKNRYNFIYFLNSFKIISNNINLSKKIISNNLSNKIIFLNILKNKYYELYLYKKYVSILYLNKNKFNYTNLIKLKKILSIFYNKNINIIIINLKYLHLDNNIFVDGIIRKLKDRKLNVLDILKKSFILAKISILDSILKIENENKDNLDDYKYSLIKYFEFKNKRQIKEILFKSIKNIHIIGLRLEGKGRLTRRLTASRAVFKKKYIGNKKNIFSSFQKLSSTMSKGFENSNISYVNRNSYNRNGAFGVKSWQNNF